MTKLFDNAKLAIATTALFLGSMLSSCTKDNGSGGDTPTPKATEKVIMQVNASSASAVEFVLVLNPAVPENDAEGLGYIYDLKLEDTFFKASTSSQPVGQLGTTFDEAFHITWYKDNLVNNGSKTAFTPVDAKKPIAYITADDGDFSNGTGANGKIVTGLLIYTSNAGLATKNLKRNLNALEALDNAKANFEIGNAAGKFLRTINMSNPTVLTEAAIKP